MGNCRLSRVIWGLACVAVLGVVSIKLSRPHIEADLEAKARAALSKAGYSWAGFSFSGRSAYLTEADYRTSDERREALNIVRSISGVQTVEDNTKELPVASPFQWIASKNDHRVKLTRYVPSLLDRKAVQGMTKATFPGLEVVDKTSVAQGAANKNTWLGAVSYALKQLSYIKKGHVMVQDGVLSVSGRTVDSDSYIAISEKIRENKPNGVELGSIKVAPPKIKPYVWSMVVKDGNVHLNGYLPDLKSHQELSLLLEGAVNGVKIVDNLGYASGQPKGWKKVLKLVAQHAAYLKDFDISISNREIRVRGYVGSEEMLARVKEGLHGSVPKNFTLKENIVFEEKGITARSPDKRQAFNRGEQK